MSSSGARWKKSDAGWLTLAALVHACLLLVPIHQPDSPENSTIPLRLQLVSIPTPVNIRVETELAETPASEPTIEDNLAEENQVTAPTTALDPTPASLVPASGEHTPEQSRAPSITTARLIELARTADLDSPPAARIRALGLYATPGLPGNWRSGMTSRAVDNLFDDMVAPGKTEVVDRWLAADGSHNVVLDLPNGETLCGRATAWDPMQPLVEHVMMLRKCGGGGKRTFNLASSEMRERKHMEK